MKPTGDSPVTEAAPDDQDDGGAVLDPKIQEAIGRSLKAHYNDIASAPIPDRFLALLAALEAKENQPSGR